MSGLSGLTIEAVDLPLPTGALCRIQCASGAVAHAEVVGFDGSCTLLMPLGSMSGISRGDAVEKISIAPRVWCCRNLLGRVLDGFGNPIDGKGALPREESRRIDGRGVAALERSPIRKPISTSVRSIDALHTCGLGQRMGIFSGPGVGKSTLLSQIARHTSADVCVIALIGERAREVQEFIERALGPQGMAKSVVIVSLSDDAPLLRVRAAKAACTIAEYFRDQGHHVLLLMDSLTRMAQAQRQIGLAAREPPATRGYPPSVFALIPEILERAGNTPVGSITGFYTVLVEGDDFNEPIPDAVKGVTDGHLWLSRSLANRGQFPAIDVMQSISRVRSDVVEAEQVRMARRVISLLAVYQDIEDLVNIGAYVPGASAENDLAVQMQPRIIEFLRQEPTSPVTLAEASARLKELHQHIEQAERTIHASRQAKTARRSG